MSGPSPSAVLSLLRSQLLIHPKPSKSSFSSQTVIVTGGNTGLGREAAKQIVQLDAAKVIITSRNVAKGEAAREYIQQQTGRDIVEVWQLDLSSFESVRAFAKRAETLDRLDAATITTNVISTSMLANLLLPVMLRTSDAYPDLTPRMTFVGSGLHKFATLKARKAPGSVFDNLKELSADNSSDQDMRYNDSKLLLQLYASRLSTSIPTSSATKRPKVCINVVNPGYCISNLVSTQSIGQKVGERLLARSTEEGGQALVDAVAAECVDGRHGAYVDDMQVKKPAHWIGTKEGQETKERVWQELNAILGVAQ
ncbi:Short chain dehydrogenase atnD [Pseudocercospora fuligena]|uniref:Short chain dehydrogenase atnD n=1 Tax=Pseudocercospora fuligena TaxID=685502 RepID=A0A8H6RA00_9PEZI|nr:Short chain dehydrogenase atnD [Pseudocercospora fuligena]